MRTGPDLRARVKDGRFIFGAVAVVLAVGTIGFVVIYNLVPLPPGHSRFTHMEWTTFAELFGALVGTLFSALAFAWLIYTARMQQQELQLQRGELEATRAELAKTAGAEERIAEALKVQARSSEYATRLQVLKDLLIYLDAKEKDIRRLADEENNVARLSQISSDREAIYERIFETIRDFDPERLPVTEL